jgi:hypothetical protein
MRSEFTNNFKIIDAALGKYSTLPTAAKGNFVDVIIEIYNALKAIADGKSGADFIGATSIQDLDGVTVQTILESLRNKLKSTADGSSGADFLNATEITGLSGTTVQALLEALKAVSDAHNTRITNTEIVTNDINSTYQVIAAALNTGQPLGLIFDGGYFTDSTINDTLDGGNF